MRALLPFLGILSAASALHFYFDGSTPKCFFEDLPKDTLVVGNYSAEEYMEHASSWQQNADIGIYIFVDEVFDNSHRVVSQRGSSAGRFTFTAQEAGDHKICLTPYTVSGHPLPARNAHHAGSIKMKLDLVIGATSQIESSDKDKLQDITVRIKDLNARLNDIRREQVFQREREAEFRDQSESTNGRVVRWIIIQLIVIGVTCAWQLSHLRSFFIKQKLT